MKFLIFETFLVTYLGGKQFDLKNFNFNCNLKDFNSTQLEVTFSHLIRICKLEGDSGYYFVRMEFMLFSGKDEKGTLFQKR